MKKAIKKLPFLLAFVVTMIAASCSDIAIEPVHGDDDDTPIIIPPPKPGSSATAYDSTAIG